jgi:hypothetical protein
MVPMSRLAKPRGLALWTAVLVLLPLACSRPVDMPQAENQNRQPDSGLPFGDRQSLPVGTLVTVRLKNPIVTDNPGFSKTFDAVIDEPVLVEGNAVVPRGASVQGRVQSAYTSG